MSHTAAAAAPLGFPLAAALLQTVLLNGSFVAAMVLLADQDPFDGTARDFLVVGGLHALDIVVVLGLFVAWFGGRTPASLGWSPDPAPGRSLGLGLLGGLGCVTGMACLMVALGGTPAEVWSAFAEVPLQQRALLVTVGLGAAFVEESVFRGVLQPALIARLGRPVGIVVGAVLFSVYHLKFAPLPLLVKAVFGVVFGLLADRTGRLWAPALAHLCVWTVVGLS